MDRTQVLNERLGQLQAALHAADLSRVVVAYDFGSDEFLLLFEGGTRPGVSRVLGGGWMMRVDRETGEPIGLQIEHFLSRAATEHPQLLALLDIAELTGTTVEKLAQERRRVVEAQREKALRDAIAAVPATLAAD
jgi:hypothetical protein